MSTQRGWKAGVLLLCLLLASCKFASKTEPSSSAASAQPPKESAVSQSQDQAPANPAPDTSMQPAVPSETDHSQQVAAIHTLQAEQEADVTGFTENELRSLFYSSPLDADMIARLNGDQLDANADYISMDDYRLVRLLYCDFEGRTKVGELICNQLISGDLENIFFELYQNAYPIGRVVLPWGYGMDDESITADNITRCLGTVWTEDGSSYPQEHSLGLAIDLNSLYNPQHITEDGQDICYPEAGRIYLERNGEPYRIDENDLAYQVFTRYGFFWGGTWPQRNDYQHFEKYFNHETNQADTNVFYGMTGE